MLLGIIYSCFTLLNFITIVKLSVTIHKCLLWNADYYVNSFMRYNKYRMRNAHESNIGKS